MFSGSGSYTIPVAGKYKINLVGGDGGGGSGTIIATKTFSSGTVLQIKGISGGWWKRGSSYYYGASGTGLWEGGTKVKRIITINYGTTGSYP